MKTKTIGSVLTIFLLMLTSVLASGDIVTSQAVEQGTPKILIVSQYVFPDIILPQGVQLQIGETANELVRAKYSEAYQASFDRYGRNTYYTPHNEAITAPSVLDTDTLAREAVIRASSPDFVYNSLMAHCSGVWGKGQIAKFRRYIRELKSSAVVNEVCQSALEIQQSH